MLKRSYNMTYRDLREMVSIFKPKEPFYLIGKKTFYTKKS